MAFADNYIWIVHDDQSAVVVDPGDSTPVSDWLNASELALAAILITHHHPDHIGGVNTLLDRHGNSATIVAGPADPRIGRLTVAAGEGDRVRLPAPDLEFRVLEVPGHTRTHIAYYNERWLFAGDTLFSAGCGRLFEGTPAQMQHSLDKFRQLPDKLLLCCGHEYTAANCRFAMAVEPDNQALRARAGEVQSLRRTDRPSLPVSLAREFDYNPFLRTRHPAVIAAARRRKRDIAEDPAAVFGVIREWKDNFA